MDMYMALYVGWFVIAVALVSLASYAESFAPIVLFLVCMVGLAILSGCFLDKDTVMAVWIIGLVALAIAPKSGGSIDGACSSCGD